MVQEGRQMVRVTGDGQEWTADTDGLLKKSLGKGRR